MNQRGCDADNGSDSSSSGDSDSDSESSGGDDGIRQGISQLQGNAVEKLKEEYKL